MAATSIHHQFHSVSPPYTINHHRPSFLLQPNFCRPKVWPTLRSPRLAPHATTAAGFTKYSVHLFYLSDPDFDLLRENAFGSISPRNPLILFRRFVRTGLTLGKWFALRYVDSYLKRSDQMFVILHTTITTMKTPTYTARVMLLAFKSANSRFQVVDLVAFIHKTDFFFQKLHLRPCFFHVPQPLLLKDSRRTDWSIGSNVNGGEFDPSSINNSNGGTRLLRAILTLRIKLSARLLAIKKDLLIKVLSFLLGFYCATAFATVIGQTGDWDILSAAVAVAVVEGIGALMYKPSLQFIKFRGLIAIFNYWKAGLSLGLFLDSFKY